MVCAAFGEMTDSECGRGVRRCRRLGGRFPRGVRGGLLSAAVLLGAATGAAPAFSAEPANIVTEIERYQIDRSDLLRFYRISVDPARFDRIDALNAAWMERLRGIRHEDLDDAGTVDAVLLRSFLERDQHATAFNRQRQAEIAALVPFAESVIALETARWNLQPIDAREAATVMDALATEVAELHTRVRAAHGAARTSEGDSADAADGSETVEGQDGAQEINLTPVTALRAAQTANEIVRTLRSWFTYHDGFKPEFSWWVRQPYEAVTSALTEYVRFLREDVAGQRGKPDDPLVGDPLGAAMLERELAGEFIPFSPRELIEIGWRELQWCAAQMKDAAARLGYDDWRDALEYVKTLHVAPGEQDMLVAAQAQHAIDFVDERDLVTVPDLCRETWRIEMLSAERQRVLPFAAYGGQHMLVAYPTSEMDHTRKIESMRGNNIHFTRLVTPHELIPGHHLQLFYEARYSTHRRLFRTPFLLEGWALHWEMLLYDLGYAESPENEIGMLFWRMHRCARIIVSLKFHLDEMSSAEMIDFLVEQVGHERDGATSEVRRYVSDAYGPLYQAAYMVGGLQMRALHAELVGTGRMTDRAFHDAVLKCGNIPIELIRAQLLGERLPLDFQSQWRF